MRITYMTYTIYFLLVISIDFQSFLIRGLATTQFLGYRLTITITL